VIPIDEVRNTPMTPKKLTPANLLRNARAMRQESSHPEIILWARLRNRQLGEFKFRRQAPMPPFIADFYCAEAKVVVEVDGPTHAGRETYDDRRSNMIERNGLLVLRFTNHDVVAATHGVLMEILEACDRQTGRAAK